MGSSVSLETFAGICLELQTAGAANINLVTGTHFIPSIMAGLHMARDKGLVLPVLWNTSGFESKSGLLLLDRFVDVFLPDLKTVSEEVSRRIFHCAGYADAACRAVLKMAENRPLEWNGNQLVRGVIVRHLVLPGEIESTRQTLSWYAENLKETTLLSLMFQYTPLKKRPDIPQRMVDIKEYEEVLSVMEDLGINDGFVQALEEETEWFPDFRRENPFPSDLSKVVWHHQKGFVRR
jgi:putative pyruvate formate lyase activating enzyme